MSIKITDFTIGEGIISKLLKEIEEGAKKNKLGEVR